MWQIPAVLVAHCRSLPWQADRGSNDMMGNNAAFLAVPGLSHMASELCTRPCQSHALSTDFSPGRCVTARRCPHTMLGRAREHGQTPAPHVGTRTGPRGMLSLWHPRAPQHLQGGRAGATRTWGLSHMPCPARPGLRRQQGSAAAPMPAPKASRCTCYECKRPPIASSNQLRSCKQLMNLKFLPGVDPGDTGMKWQAHQTEIASCSLCTAC